MREERLKHLHRERHRVCAPAETDQHIVVEERNEAGRARVRLRVRPGCRAVSVDLGEKREIAFLDPQENADGSVLVQESDGTWTAHVLECKRTVRTRDWEKAQRQLRAGMVRLQVFADFLGIRVARWAAHVAFRHDHLSPDASPELALLEVSVGPDPKETELTRQRRAWMDGRLLSPPFVHEVPVARILLDDDGHGSATL